MVTGIDRPTAGTVTVDGLRIDAMSEEELAVWRGENVGVVFQFFQLLPTLSALENAVLPLDFARRGSKRERFERARHNLELVGLGDKVDHLPAELSGGEQQRVAIARALASDPKLVVGDEPTGNLDTVTAAEMFELLERLNAEGKTILYVTHDLELAARAHRIVTIRDGLVVALRGHDVRAAAQVDHRPEPAPVTHLLRRRDARAGSREPRHLRDAGADGPLDAGRGPLRQARRPDRLHVPARSTRASSEARGAAERARRRAAPVLLRPGLRRRPAGARRRGRRPRLRAASASTSSTSTRVRRRVGEVLTDVQNANQGRLGARTRATPCDARRRRLVHTLRVSGVGRNLHGGKWVADDNVVVLYATPATVGLAGGVPGYGWLPFRLAARGRPPVASTLAASATTSRAVPGFTRLHRPARRARPRRLARQGRLPQLRDFFFVITVLALLSALVLIANTMTTLVAEQTPRDRDDEGDRRAAAADRGGVRQDRAAARRARDGPRLALGIALSNVLVRFLGSTFFAIDVGFGVDRRVLARASSSACSGRRSRRCRRSGAPSGAAPRGARGERLRGRRAGRRRPAPAAGPLPAPHGPDRAPRRRAAAPAQPRDS